MSGFQLATGTVGPPAGLPIDPAAFGSQPADLLLVVAAALIAGAIGFTFVLARRIAPARGIAACGAAQAILVYEVLIRIRGNLQGRVERPGDGDPAASGNSAATANQVQRQMEQITVDVQIWFWLTLAALAAAILLLTMVHYRGDGADRRPRAPQRPSIAPAKRSWPTKASRATPARRTAARVSSKRS